MKKLLTLALGLSLLSGSALVAGPRPQPSKARNDARRDGRNDRGRRDDRGGRRDDRGGRRDDRRGR
jgi:hypothetical protein